MNQKLSISKMKRQKLNHVCKKLSKLNFCFVWFNQEFYLIEIKYSITPTHISECLKEFQIQTEGKYCKIIEGIDNYEFSKLGKGCIRRILEGEAI